MNWAVGITTIAARHNDLLKLTVASLQKTGFNNIVLFVDGLDPKWNPPVDNLGGVVLHEPAVGHLANWMLSLLHLYTVYVKVDRYAIFEDDLLCSANLREYLERCTYPAKGYWNLITHPDNLVMTGGQEGWHLSNQRGRGAVGLVFDRKTAGDLLAAKNFLERPRYCGNMPAADGMVIDSLKPLGYSEYIHYPTLIQHIGGGKSTMGHKYGEMPAWRGEDYNLLELLNRRPFTISQGSMMGTTNTEPVTPEQSTLQKLVPPSKMRPTVWRGGVIQIHVTRACDMACCSCTQGSNLGGKPVMISLEDFDLACQSLKGYWGIVGMFGGNPAVHPQFEALCHIFSQYFPRDQRGLWCNHPRGKGKVMRQIFNPSVSNLNVHLNRAAFDEFKRDWPESNPFGLEVDSRHSPPYVAMLDVVPEENKRWELIGNCDINKHWSAMVCSVPNKGLRGFFCEIAGAQAILHANDPNWPDTGIPIAPNDSPLWWKLPMQAFAEQVRYNCHRCGVPLRRKGELAVVGNKEEVSATHKDVFKPKVRDRHVELVQLDTGPKLQRVTDYVQNASI